MTSYRPLTLAQRIPDECCAKHATEGSADADEFELVLQAGFGQRLQHARGEGGLAPPWQAMAILGFVVSVFVMVSLTAILSDLSFGALAVIRMTSRA